MYVTSESARLVFHKAEAVLHGMHGAILLESGPLGKVISAQVIGFSAEVCRVVDKVQAIY
jgi:hypothetical protein